LIVLVLAFQSPIVNLGNSGWHFMIGRARPRLISSQFFRAKVAPLPAGFAGLACVTLIVVATSATASAKALSTASATARRIRLWFRFIDLQGTAGQFSSVQGRDRLVGFRRIGHFHKGETASTASFAIGHNADLFDCAMRFKQSAQLWFGGAVG
jgi:hypothetical protein